MEQSVDLSISELKRNISSGTERRSSTDTIPSPSHSDNNDPNSKETTEEPIVHFEISKDPFSDNYIWKQTTPYVSNGINMPSLDSSTSNYTISHSSKECAEVPSLTSQPQTPNPKKRKGIAVHYSSTQYFALEKTFLLDKYPSKMKRRGLAKELSLTENKVDVWFCNRRTKEKKENSTDKTERTVRHNVSPSKNELAPVSNKTINDEKTPERNKPDSFIVNRLSPESAMPIVSPSPASITTSAEAIPNLPEWYPGFHPMAYPIFNPFMPNSWGAGYYGHGPYRPIDYGYYDMGLPRRLPIQYPPFDYRNLLY